MNMDLEQQGRDEAEMTAMQRLAALEDMVVQMQQQRATDQAEITTLRTQIQQQQQAPVVQPAPVQQPAVNPPAQNVVTPKQPGEIIKPPMPAMYDGDMKKTEAFLTDMRTYFRYFPTTIATDEMKVSVAASRLDKTAKDWFEPFQRDFEATANNAAQRKATTTTIYSSYAEFEKQLKTIFGATNEKKEAENQLLSLKQKGSCSKFTAEFMRISAKTDMDDASKRVLYYQGLKSEVKDELARDDLPDSFEALSKKATRIDDRLYERRKERGAEKHGNQKPFPRGNFANQGKKRDVATYNDGKPGPMDLDTIDRKKHDRRSVECFNCGKKGHIKKFCHSPPKKDNNKRWSPVPEPQDKKSMNTIAPAVNHGSLNWTVCYDDNCLIHLSEKQGSGWFPQKPRNKKCLNTLATQPLDDEYSNDGISDSDMIEAEELEIWNKNQEISQKERQEMARLNKIWEAMKTEQPERGHCEGCGSWDADDAEHNCGYRSDDQKPAISDVISLHPSTDGIAERAMDKPTPCGTETERGLAPAIPTKVAISEKLQERPQYHRSMNNLTTSDFLFMEANVEQDPFVMECGKKDGDDCNEVFCRDHVVSKVMDWHDWKQQTTCGQPEFAFCDKYYCNFHNAHRWALKEVSKKLTRDGYDLMNHTARVGKYNPRNREPNPQDIKQYHRLTRHLEPKQGCYWCEKYYTRKPEVVWMRTDIDDISTEDGTTDNRYLNSMETNSNRRNKFLVEGTLEGHAVTVYIDSGATASYIAPQLVNRLQLPNHPKEPPYSLMSIEAQKFSYNGGIVDRETDHLNISFCELTDSFQFDVANIQGYDLLLGYDWLGTRNPMIDWVRGHVEWRNHAQPGEGKQRQ